MPRPSRNPQTEPVEQLLSVVEWSKQLTPWMQDALRRLHQTGSITSADEEELLRICLGQHGIVYRDQRSVTPVPLADSDVPTLSSSTPPATLTRLSNVVGVNALAAGQRLVFGQHGITIVFGGNGTGKSGYARVLKRACRARHREQNILGNAYASAPTQPASASITYRLGDIDQPPMHVEIAATQPVTPLARISVFDANCAHVYVDESHELAYRPHALAILGTLARTSRALRIKIQDWQRRLNDQGPFWLALNPIPFRPSTEVGRAMARLHDETVTGDVERLASLPADHEQRVADLKRDLGEPPEESIRRIRQLQYRLQQESNRVTQLLQTFADTSVATYRGNMQATIDAAEAVRLAASTAFSEAPLRGVGSEPWRRMWEAACEYARAEQGARSRFPPTEEIGRCVLCQQELDQAALSRLQKFERFVRDNVQRQADEAKRAWESHRRTYVDQPIASQVIRTIHDFVAVDLQRPAKAKLVKRLLIALKWRRRRLLRCHTADAIDQVAPITILSEMSNLATDISGRITELSKVAQSNDRRVLVDRLHELEDRAWLAANAAAVRDEVKRLATLRNLQAAYDDTNPEPVTRRSTVVARALVTDRLRDAFAKEIQDLKLAYLRVELRQRTGEIGEAKFGIQLLRSPDTAAGDIFSEGEYRCIALAAFLAELSTADESSAIVFDDPVSSLDHNHREHVAKRLATEATKRQVVVFSHDLPFVFMLDHYAEQARAKRQYQHVSRADELVGITGDNLPIKHQQPQQAIVSIRNHLTNKRDAFQHGQTEQWPMDAKGIANQLRDCWEYAVEQAVKPVVSRFTHKVAPTELRKIRVLTEQDCADVSEGYGQCSRWSHSDSPELGVPVPTPDELGAEVDRLANWLTRVAAAQAAVR